MTSFLDRVPQPWFDRFKTLGGVPDPAVKAVLLVGGCVRDMMLSRPPFDWDIMVEGDIEPVLREGEKSFRVAKTVRHPAFLTSTLHFEDGTILDVVTARTERYPRPAALPVVKPATIAEDFRRRDFTVNAMAFHIGTGRWGELEDPFNGRGDVEQGLVRVLHDQSFVDDPTRIFRAARYAGRYGWAVEPHTLDLIREALRGDRPALLSPVRRKNELSHLLSEPDAAPAMKLLWDWGAWRYWIPAWTWTPETAEALSAPAEDPLRARLSALCAAMPPEGRARFLKEFQFPKNLLEKPR